MTTYAALTNGTTTITFASPGTLGWYRIETGWTPKVAGLRQNQLGGRGPYEDVTEEIPVSIGGSTAAHMYANIQTLNTLLDKSNRWWGGENISALIFKYSPEGATVSTAASPLQASVWDASLEMSSGFTGIPQSGSAVWASGAAVRVRRNGLWSHVSASGSASGTNGDLVTVAISGGSVQWVSPTDVQMTNYVIFQTDTYKTYSLISDTASGITIINAETLSGAGWSAVSDSGNFARNGSIARFSGTFSQRLAGSISLPDGARRFGVFVNANVFYGSYRPYIRAVLANGSLYDVTAQTANVPIFQMNSAVSGASTAGYYGWCYLGAVTTSFQPTYFEITPTISGSVGIEIDSAVIVDLDHTGILASLRNNTLGVIAQETAVAYSGYLTNPSPYMISSASVPYTTYATPFISTSAASVYCCVLGNKGGSTGTGHRWRMTDVATGSAALSNTWTLTRTSAYTTAV